MFAREYAVDIKAPIEEVFAYVTDLQRHPEWSTNAMHMTVHGKAIAEGTTFDTSVKAFGTETARSTVIEVQAPTKFVYECDTSTSGCWRWTMTLEPVPGGTRLSHRAEGLRRPAWMKVLQPVMFPLIGKRMQVGGLENIKARIEADAARGTTSVKQR